MSDIDNPGWDAMAHAVRKSDMPWEGLQVAQWAPLEGLDPPDRPWVDRHEFVRKYTWAIPDPDGVEFVIAYSRDSVVDPMAGTGYWGYLLKQYGVTVWCYDLHGMETNHYHRNAEHWMEVATGVDAADAVTRHTDATLLLSWVPYSEDVGYRALTAYEGPRVIVIGEGEGGCTGDDKFHEELRNNWNEVNERMLVQWYGIHDYITVFDRKPEPSRFSELDIDEEDT